MDRRRFLTATATLTAGLTTGLAAAGCGTSRGSKDTSEAGSAKGFPVNFEHAFGTTTIEAPPERVVTLGWGVQDSVLALGVTPVGIPYAVWGDNGHGLLPWTADALKGKPKPTLIKDASETPVEKIASLKPDVILAQYSGIERRVYDKLSEFAPVVAYKDQPWRTTWEEQTLVTGRALGKAEEAKKLVADMTARIQAAGDKAPAIKGKTFAYVYSEDPNELQVYVKGEPRVDLLEDMGMRRAPSVADLRPPKGEFVAPLSMEHASRLADADVLLTWFDDKQQQKKLESLDLFARIPAVRRGSYVALLDRSLAMSMNTVTALGLPWGLERFLPILEKAAAKAD